jgi:hypothetical protein
MSDRETWTEPEGSRPAAMWPTDRYRKNESDARGRDQPLVMATKLGPRRIITAADKAAQALVARSKSGKLVRLALRALTRRRRELRPSWGSIASRIRE